MVHDPYEAVFEGIPLGVLVVQPGGSISLVNAAALDLLGLPRRIAEHARFREILPDTPTELLESGSAVARVPLDDRQILITACAFQGSRARLVTMRDVTDQTAIERVKAAFVSDLLHKIRTPLTTIKSSLGALASSRVDPRSLDTTELLAMSRAETDRLVRVLDDIRDLFLVDTGLLSQEIDLAEIDPFEVLDEVVRRVRREAEERGITLVREQGEAVLRVRADHRLLCRAVQKVVENSVRYARRGDHVTLAVHDRGERVELDLSDDGPGMTEEEEMRAFDRFFRGVSAPSHVPDGIGIGLTLARDLVQLMGGEVTLETGPDLGTSVSVFLPRAGAAS